MEPFERFKKSNTQKNLWIYFLSLGKEREIPVSQAPALVFERFGFLPGKILTSRVLYSLQRKGYIKKERFKGKRAFSTTEKGKRELDKMKDFNEELLKKI